MILIFAFQSLIYRSILCKKKYTKANKPNGAVAINLNSLTDEEFFEWFRGLVDGEGCFSISKSRNQFIFRFIINMHIDEGPMLNYISYRLKVGYVNETKSSVSFTVASKFELEKIFSFFENNPLNTTKNLNYLSFKKAYDLYNNKSFKSDRKEIEDEIIKLKDHMNSKRIEFKQPKGHLIKITPYWLLGFVEGEGYFSISRRKTDISTCFGIWQASSEVDTLKAIREFLLDLPGKYKMDRRKDTNIVGISLDNKSINENSQPGVKLQIYSTDFITNILVPFLDNLIWLSKKQLDYSDWKSILRIKNEGKHFTSEGFELILLISKRMNRNRLSTNRLEPYDNLNLDERTFIKTF